MSHTNAQKEKRSAALSSVLFAIGLTAFKIIVGLLTNSLGILAEAAHSALDLVAALMTLFAVRMADKPADKEHNFGHGKIENLSALFETILLLATSAWIIHEAIDRLFFTKAEVEVSIWSFIVMGTSIAIDSHARGFYLVLPRNITHRRSKRMRFISRPTSGPRAWSSSASSA